MLQVLERLDRIEEYIAAIDYRGGKPVKDEQKTGPAPHFEKMFDKETFLSFGVTKSSLTNRKKTRKCLFALEKQDANAFLSNDRRAPISIYWYSYSLKSIKVAKVVKDDDIQRLKLWLNF